MDRPTGRPSTVAPGQAHLRMAGQSAVRAEAGDAIAHRLERRQRLAPGGAGNGVVGRQRMVPGGSRCAIRPRASWRISAAQPCSRRRDHRAHQQRAGDREGEARIALVEPRRLKVLPRLDRLQRALRARPHREALRRQISSRHVADQARRAASPSAAAPRRPRHRRSRRRRRRRPGWSAGRAGSARPASPTRPGRRSRRRARTSRSCRSVGAWGSMPVGVEPAVRRADAVEAAEARRHAHRAAGIGAERGVA